MKLRWIAFLIILACFGAIYWIGKDIPSELAPMEDRSQFRLTVSAAEGASYEFMDKYVDKISQFIIDSVPENKILMSMVAPGFTGSGSVNSGFVRSVSTGYCEHD
jgi:multidrug efflux pump